MSRIHTLSTLWKESKHTDTILVSMDVTSLYTTKGENKNSMSDI